MDLENKQAISAKEITIQQCREWLRPITDRARQDRCAYKPRGGTSKWADKPLDATRINEHFAGTTGCGVGFITPGQSTTRLALLDLDDHKGQSSFEDMTTAAGGLCIHLETLGMRPTVFKSSGGKGLHIWLLWQDHQDAHSVRHALQGVLTASGYCEGAGEGIAGGQVEIFPKQASVSAGRNGNYAILPLWNQSMPMLDEFGMGSFEEVPRAAVLGMPWPMSDAVPVVASEARATSAATGGDAPDDIGEVKRALYAIPNGQDGPDYSEWFKLLCATREATGGSDAGFEAFAAWTAQNPGNKTPLQRSKWDQNDNGGTTRKTLYLTANNAMRTPDGLPDGGAPTALDSYALELVDPNLIDMTDSGNVNLLARQTQGNLRHVSERGMAIWWTGKRWVEDPSRSISTQQALKVAAHYKHKAARAQKDADAATETADRKAHLKLVEIFKAWANKSRCRTGIDAMLALAWRDPRFAISQAALDTDIYLLGVQNGVVDLRTGQLRPAGRDDFVTQLCACDYKPDAAAPVWLKTLNEVTAVPVADGRGVGLIQYQPRPELAHYWHMFLGYALTGSTAEHKIVFATGGGSNGKSLIFETVAGIMADYCGVLSADVLMASKTPANAEGPTPFARSVAGKRLIIASEGKEGQKLNASMVKRMTGDAKMSARGLQENAFTFTVTHKTLLLTNYQPELDQMDDAIAGRIHSVPFDRQWNRPSVASPNPRLADGDKHLGVKLCKEQEGILAWLVAGAVGYMAEGLNPPPAVAEKTMSYLGDQDAMGRWLDDMETCEIGQGMAAGELFGLFGGWCVGAGVASTHSNLTTFAKALQGRGILRQKVRTGVTYGLREIPFVDIF